MLDIAARALAPAIIRGVTRHSTLRGSPMSAESIAERLDDAFINLLVTELSATEMPSADTTAGEISAGGTREPGQHAATGSVVRLRFTMDGSTYSVLEIGDAIVTIGRDPSNAVVLTDSLASRFHTHVRREADSTVVEDLGSRNGTMVNGSRIRKRKLAVGDVIQVPGCQLRAE